MRTKTIIVAVFLFSGLTASAQSVSAVHSLPKFMGREITVTEPERDADGFFPKGPASVCIQGPPRRQCYTAPTDFGNSPTATVVQLKKGVPALLFSAASGGVSGWEIHLALLRPATGKDLEELLNISVPNQNQYAFWNDVTISAAQIFVTAAYVWGPDEAHYAAHRYIVSSYVWTPDSLGEYASYYLEERYMTTHKYDQMAGADILSSEKQEILARLRRVKAMHDAEARQDMPR
jgi:hypothetical protein